MSLKNLLALSSDRNATVKQGLSEERVRAQMDNLRHLIAFFREYPDLLVDFLLKDDNPKNFHFYYYQRYFLRAVMRHRYVYAVFPRAYSKSFLSMMALMLRCVLYPNSHLFVTTGGKEQAASITVAKIQEICTLIPPLNNEINWDRGVSKKSKDDVSYIFKNGSSIDILAARETSRGQRRTGGLMEECVLIDQTALNEIIIPTTNVDRLLPDGSKHREEKVNQSQIYITTAGWRNSFAYSKLIELLIRSVIEPDEVMVMGGTYETPVEEGLLSENFVDELKLSGTFNEDSFDREYRSIWGGDVANAFYSSEAFDACRILNQAEYEFSGRTSKNAYYVIGIDVGRFRCTTEAMVFKVTPQPRGASLKSLVNLYTYEATHFEDQAINIKRLYYKYKARAIAIDGGGVGAGLVDFLTKSQIDPESGDTLPDFGVINDKDGKYKKQRTAITEHDALYIIKSDPSLNSEAYIYAKNQIASRKIKLLIDESTAKAKLMETKVGQNMSTDQRNEYLKPYTLTTILKEQMLNLISENEGTNVILKQSSKSIKKDKFSALIYGLYYIHQEEERLGKRKRYDISDFLFFS